MVTSTTPSDSSEHTEAPDGPPKQAVSWKQFLLRDYQRSDDDPGLSQDFFWSIVLVLVWFAVIAVVTTVLVKNWPEKSHMYKSDNPFPKEGYTCACSLPATLQEPDSLADPADSQGTLNFNECYSRGSLETISVLQYATNNTDIDATVRKYNTTNVLYRSTEGGYVVTQVAHELSIRGTVSGELTLLYRNDEIGYADEDIWFPLEGYVLSAEFMSFPESYVRMTFRYSCNNCSLCGLSIINDYIYNATGKREKWGLCYYYGREDAQQCNQTDDQGFTYEGKCVLYPTRTLPFAFALKSFINKLLKTTGIRDVFPFNTKNPEFLNYSSVQPNVLYLNSSSVTRGVLQHGFVEYPKGSTLRAWLLNNLPSSDTPCSAIPDLQDSEFSGICNGTSICNAFVDADQSIELKCQNMRDNSTCRNIVNNNDLSVDNKYNSSVGVRWETICPQFSCVSDISEVPAYKVTRTFPVNTTDPINQYLNSSTLSRDWLRMSGICTNTYNLVYRFNDTMFLQANCTDGTDLCKLTGQVYRLDDYYQDDRELNSFDSKSGELFVCFRVTKESWPLWFLNYVNVLFSWISVLIFLYLSGVYKLVRFLRARYSSTDSRNNNQTTSLDGNNPHPTYARGLSGETSEQELVSRSVPIHSQVSEKTLLFNTPRSA